MPTISVIDITIRCIDYVDGVPQIPFKEIRKAVPLESLPKTIQSSQLPESVLAMVLESLYEVESLQPTV
jgi:hypothetical protein